MCFDLLSRIQEPHQEQGREESQQHGNSISQVRKSIRHHIGISNRTRPAQEKKSGFWNGYVISELRVWILCRYEVTSKDELLQDIYLEEEKAPPE